MDTLKKTFSKQQFALEAAGIGSWEWDIESNTVTWSDNLEEIHGMKRGEFGGKFESFISYVHPDDREQLKAKIQQSSNEDIPYQIEHRWVRKNGEIIWLEGKGQVIHDDYGQPKGMIGICMDITKRKNAELALQKSEEKYRSLFDSMDEGFCIIEVLFDENDKACDYLFLEVNSSFEKQSGIKAPKGKKALDLFPNLERYWFERFGEVVRTGETIRFDDQISDLENRWYHMHAFPIGEPEEHRVAVLLNDITEQKKKNRSDALLGAIVNDSDDAIISKNLDGIITSWNVGAEHMFGYTSEETIGQSITRIISKERLDEENMILGKIKKGERVHHFETKRQCKNGSLTDVSLTISPIKDDTERIVGASKIARDITEQKRAEQELKKLNETLEERVEERTASLLSYQNQLRSLAMQLSRAEEQEQQRLASDLHDNLGQLLAVCKMKVSLMQEKDENPELEEVLELVDDAIVYTRELMSDLKPPSSLEDKDLKSAIGWIAKKMKKHDLKVTIEETDDQPKPLNEEVRSTLLRSIRELLFNVVKHAGADTASITLWCEGGQVKASVEDKGPGFNPDDKNKESLDKGFGLFSIYERMNFLNGNMEIESQPGKGTKVILTVPVMKGEKTIATEKNVSKSSSSKTNKKIKVLLADDHQIVREGLRKKMEEENHLTVIAEASDGEEALKLAKETSPDIIVMDVTMPKMDGVTATQKIKKALPDIHVIGLSSYEDEGFAREMMNAGASAYLAKSDAFETLSATIRSAANVEKQV